MGWAVVIFAVGWSAGVWTPALADALADALVARRARRARIARRLGSPDSEKA